MMSKKQSDQKKSSPEVVCIGSISLDIFFPTKEGEIINTPTDLLSQKKIAFELGAKYKVSNRYEMPGGCAANVSHGLAKLGIHSMACGVVGSDAAGLFVRETLAAGGVSTSGIKVLKKERTDLAFILVDEKSGERTIFLNRSANEHSQIEETAMNKAEWIFVSALYGDWRRHLTTILVIKKKSGVRLAYNPGQANIHEDPSRVISTIREASILFVNTDEAREICSTLNVTPDKKQDFSMDKMMDALKGLGPEVVIITDGESGAWAFDGKNLIHALTIKTKAIDTTGAGDAFSSGFLAAFLLKQSLIQCLQWGIINGASVVQHYGAHEGLLKYDQIKHDASHVYCEHQ